MENASISSQASATTEQVESAEWYVKCVFRKQNEIYSLANEIQTTVAEVVG